MQAQGIVTADSVQLRHGATARREIVLAVDLEPGGLRPALKEFANMGGPEADPRSRGDRSRKSGSGVHIPSERAQPFLAGAAGVKEPPAILLHRPLGRLTNASGWRSFSAVPAQELLAVW